MYRKALSASVVLLTFLICVSAAYAQKEDGGLGVMIGQLYDPSSDSKKGEVVILHVVEGTPAHARGLKAGDFITHINGTPTTRKNLEDIALKELRGPVGTPVRLTIERPPNRQTLNVELIRAVTPK